MNSIPIGVISMFWARPFTDHHLPLFERARAAGMDFIELLVPEPGELDLVAARRAAEAAGLGIELAARIDLARDLASADPAARESGAAYLEFCVESAVALGARIVGGPLYGAPLVFAGRAPAPVAEAERLRRVDHAVAGLKRAGRRAADSGVVLAVEPLNRFETDFCSTTENGVELVDRVGSPAVGLMLDTFHMNMDDPAIGAAIRRAGKRLVHFQANENNRDFIGAGHVDWPDVARALAEIDYRGPITLEPFRRNEHRLGAPLAQWRAPEEDEDEKLAASAAVLAGLLGFARPGIMQ